MIVSDIGPSTQHQEQMLSSGGNQEKDCFENVKSAAELFEKVGKASITSKNTEKDEEQEDEKDESELIDSEQNRTRRHSKSVDEFELAHLRKKKQQDVANKAAAAAVAAAATENSPRLQQMSLDIIDSNEPRREPSRQASMPNAGCNLVRRTSKDDSDIGSGAAERKIDASVLRKRFARLLDTLRSHKFSITSVEENAASSSTSNATNNNHS